LQQVKGGRPKRSGTPPDEIQQLKTKAQGFSLRFLIDILLKMLISLRQADAG
jgi:hypothetical protein